MMGGWGFPDIRHMLAALPSEFGGGGEEIATQFKEFVEIRINYLEGRECHAPPQPRVWQQKARRTSAWSMKGLVFRNGALHWPAASSFMNVLLDNPMADLADTGGKWEQVSHPCSWKPFGVWSIYPPTAPPLAAIIPHCQCLNGLLFPNPLFPPLGAQQGGEG